MSEWNSLSLMKNHESDERKDAEWPAFLNDVDTTSVGSGTMMAASEAASAVYKFASVSIASSIQRERNIKNTHLHSASVTQIFKKAVLGAQVLRTMEEKSIFLEPVFKEEDWSELIQETSSLTAKSFVLSPQCDLRILWRMVLAPHDT